MTVTKPTELVVFAVFIGAVSLMGFFASRWQAGPGLGSLDEWGLGGRRFGTWTSWFLMGGNIYTGYTFVAVPALVFGAGAMGFLAVPYAIVLFPLVMMPLLRLWSVSRVHGYVTPADFVRGRYGSSSLALVVAVTGIVATVPYLALQLVVIEAVLRTMGLNDAGRMSHLPLVVAFALIALFTLRSGLRAPALVSFVKDVLIFLVVLVAVLYLPIKFGGWDGIFAAGEARFRQSTSPADGLLLNVDNQLHYATLALGSALALFLYPHAATGALAARSRSVVKRNMAALPVFTLVLGLTALLGYGAVAAGVRPIQNNATGRADNNTIIPVLFDQQFPDWFAGVAFAAVGIAALVPAAIMAIAAANLWTRNVYREYVRPDAAPAQEARQARWASLLVLLAALAFIVVVDPQNAIDLHLIGGVLILQTLPAVAISLYTRWFHRRALIAGWFVGMAYGVWMLYQVSNPTTRREHFGGSAYPLADLSFFGLWEPFAGSTRTIYAGFVALLANLLVAAVLSVLLRRLRTYNGPDATHRSDYFADEDDLRPRPGPPVAMPVALRR